jgi:hypothetical protein
MVEEGVDLLLGHLSCVVLSVEEDEAANLWRQVFSVLRLTYWARIMAFRDPGGESRR